MPNQERVSQLIDMVQRGQFVQAIEAFYGPQATMQACAPQCRSDRRPGMAR